MILGLAGQTAAAELVNASTGGPFSGTVTVYVTINGLQALGGVGGGLATAIGNGLYEYYPAAGETAAPLVLFTFTGPGAIPVTVQYATVTAAQQAALVAAGSIGAIVVSQLITGALFEIKVARAGDQVAPETLQYGLQLFNELLDGWNGIPDHRAIYAVDISTFTLVPSLVPHTIGPTGTFVTASRPVNIAFAQVDLGGGPPDVYRPIWLRDKRWYANQSVPALTSTFPTDLYYAPDWPNGSLYFWPVPTTAYTVRLWLQALLLTANLSTTVSFPPGYQLALRLTLAERLARGMGQPLSADLKQDARDARAAIFANNEEMPALHTADSGLGTAAPSTFNWMDRSSR
jgi:hypothetical protein